VISTGILSLPIVVVTKINNSGWKAARSKADLRHVRVHDIKHTFENRLRATEVSFEDRQELLGHKTKNITTIIQQQNHKTLLWPIIRSARMKMAHENVPKP
tara:strand:- start:65 stop:367 length:303 start_codon:yes stop_codon:yes gene_type:complete